MTLNNTIITYEQAEAYIHAHMTSEQYDKWLQESDNQLPNEDDYEFSKRWLKENALQDNETDDLAYCLYWCNE